MEWFLLDMHDVAPAAKDGVVRPTRDKDSLVIRYERESRHRCIVDLRCNQTFEAFVLILQHYVRSTHSEQSAFLLDK